MDVLMFGWEFPPYASGGLGTACYGLTKGLCNNHVNVTFVVPKVPDNPASSHVKLIGADNIPVSIKIKEINSLIVPYITSQQYSERFARIGSKSPGGKMYGKDLYAEVARYAEQAKQIAMQEKFDIIHAHDWMTYKAGINAKKISGKPLVVHVHATEFDRTGGHPNQHVYDIEREGMHAADCIIAVSNFTKGLIVQHYGIAPEKVKVVHNAIDLEDKKDVFVRKNGREKIVLFLGRITIQKGPDYFLYAAKRVLEQKPDVRFVFAGSGDMEPFIIEKAAELGIADRVLFAGFLQGEDIVRAYKMADLFVMPSISEPFGLTPLEAMSHGTPVIISKQSGVSEVLSHALKVDFWDIDRMADMMLSVLKHDVLRDELSDNGLKELEKFSWNEAAQKCVDVYNEVAGAQHG